MVEPFHKASTLLQLHDTLANATCPQSMSTVKLSMKQMQISSSELQYAPLATERQFYLGQIVFTSIIGW
uniref:Uncharacterized protein n=1 Tax=Arundo donax TaxID=35708 RepID=A0A0A8ZZ68_ARUDO